MNFNYLSFTDKKIVNIFSLIFLFGAFYYLYAELFTILNTTASINAYYLNTISELSVPYEISKFSSQFKIMESAFFVNGTLFFICYTTLFLNRLSAPKTATILFTLLLTLGVIMVGLFHCKSEYSTLHIIGTVLTFLFGNIIILWTG